MKYIHSKELNLYNIYVECKRKIKLWKKFINYSKCYYPSDEHYYNYILYLYQHKKKYTPGYITQDYYEKHKIHKEKYRKKKLKTKKLKKN
mgnify:CR=1 FL=1